jgi:uncharacterized membrane protein
VPRIFSIKPALTMRGRKFKGIRGLSGKPFHPPLTDIPIACYILAGVFDVISYFSYSDDATSTVAHDFFVSATHVLIAGAIVSVPTILTGFWDWLKSTPSGSQAWRTANVHMAVMLTMSMIVAADILLRLGIWDAGATDGTVMILSVVVAILVSIGSLYGGSMVYDYAFNVEMKPMEYAYTPSEVDVLPGHEPPGDGS